MFSKVLSHLFIVGSLILPILYFLRRRIVVISRLLILLCFINLRLWTLFTPLKDNVRSICPFFFFKPVFVILNNNVLFSLIGRLLVLKFGLSYVLLVFSLLHYVLVSSHSQSNQMNVKNNQNEEQQCKWKRDSKHHPCHYHRRLKIMPILLLVEKTYWDAVGEHIGKCGDNHNKKPVIILQPNAVVDPVAVVVEIVDAPVAKFAVLWGPFYIRIAGIAVKVVIVLICDSAVVSVAVLQHYWIHWVNWGALVTGGHQNDKRQNHQKHHHYSWCQWNVVYLYCCKKYDELSQD